MITNLHTNVDLTRKAYCTPLFLPWILIASATTKDKVVTHGSTMARKSGSMQASMERQSRARFKVCLKSAKNLCLGHRFFDEIRQNPPILWCFQANVTDSLQKSGALSPSLTDRLLFSKRRTSRHVQWSSRRAPRSIKPPPHLQFLNNI